ncbi:DUF3854 domain-containing protein [Microcoleus sp. B7-D4]|uniref:DUF3854 domain-containing protein n=1 Tax=Microcoleus sp. B7-D4 TaxID=2818696 RepID=UPI002FD79A03
MYTTESTQENQGFDTAQSTPEHQGHIEAESDRDAEMIATSDQSIQQHPTTQGQVDLSGFGVLCSVNEKFLSPEHEAHIEGRGLLNPWARECCHSASIEQASHSLGYPVKSAGILFMGNNGQVQFRPDIREPKRGKKEPPKYLSPSGEFDAFLPTSPYTPDYWDQANLEKDCYHINDVPYVLITEGVFKAIAGCSNDIPTVSLLGVEQGLTGKKKDRESLRHLVPALRKLAEAGFGFIIAFDADALTNSNICEAERKLAKQLGKFGVPVRSITGCWPARSAIEGGEVKDTKGMDDFIQHKGIEEFRAILSKAKLFGEKENDEAGERLDKKPPTPRKVAAQIKEDYGHQWKYDNEQKTWRVWNGKCWEKIEIGAFTSLLKTTLDARNIDYRGSAYIEDVKKLLEHDLRQVRWQTWDKTQYINFSNCVLDGNENKALENSPGMGFTSYLPYEYKPLQGDLSDPLEALRVNCPKRYKFMRKAMGGDEKKMFKLLAVGNAVLKHRFHNQQQFVHYVGPPGSGKGTEARFTQKLVGRENFKGCSLERLKDGSTMASIIDKQLVVFADERKPVGIDSILSLTGGDAVSYRELHTPAADAFFYGCILICSNKPIFVGDTTGLERRLCLVHFDNPIPTEKRDYSIESEFEPEIPAYITIALSLSDTAVTQALRGTGASQIAEFKAKEWEMKCETNSVAAFFDINLVLDSAATAPTLNLYKAYKDWCEDGGLKPLSVVKFPKYLADLLADENLPAKWVKSRTSSFEGLRLRLQNDEHPTRSQTLEGSAPVEAVFCTSFVPVNAPVEALPSKDLHQLHQLEANISEENTNNHISSPQIVCNQDVVAEASIQPIQKPPSTGATGANSLPASISTGAASGEQVVQDTPSSGAVGSKHKEFKEGDRVVITEVGNLHHGQKGEVIEVSYGSSETDYEIKLDKISHNLQVITVAVPKISHAPVLMQLKAEGDAPC